MYTCGELGRKLQRLCTTCTTRHVYCCMKHKTPYRRRNENFLEGSQDKYSVRVSFAPSCEGTHRPVISNEGTIRSSLARRAPPVDHTLSHRNKINETRGTNGPHRKIRGRHKPQGHTQTKKNTQRTRKRGRADTLLDPPPSSRPLAGLASPP